jgi:hypothetical protein
MKRIGQIVLFCVTFAALVGGLVYLAIADGRNFKKAFGPNATPATVVERLSTLRNDLDAAYIEYAAGEFNEDRIENTRDLFAKACGSAYAAGYSDDARRAGCWREGGLF